MKRLLKAENYGTSNLGWLKSRFHFSFAEYYNPDNLGFGQLRVLNDDQVRPGTGFDTHPHQDMEVVSYVVEGELTHGDGMGHREVLRRGQVQYMTAGTGIYHSEHNRGTATLRFLQMWIFPDRKGYVPSYGDHRFAWEDRINRFLPLAGGAEGEAPVKIHQDAFIYASYLEPGKELSFEVKPGRQVYCVNIEGKLDVSGTELGMRDSIEVVEEEMLFKTAEGAHFLFIEMAQ
ncbi:MAG TPA: pirin family protein [Spirochaetaceae bacterium]|nr:pirin family protein [Spirochaetaceae bacterium]